MKITVTAPRILRADKDNSIVTVNNGETVDVPDAEAEKFVRLGVAVAADAQAPAPAAPAAAATETAATETTTPAT